MKVYKASMLIAAVVTAILMAWCGVTAAVTTPVLIIYTVEERNTVGVLLLTVLALSGLITSQASRKHPCPLPQLLMSMALGVGHTAVTAWMNGFIADHPAALGGMIQRAFQTTGLILPAVAAASAVFSLPSLFVKNPSRKSHAVLNLFSLLALIVTADSAMTILDLPVLAWQQIAQSVSILSTSRYRNMLLAAMQAYNGISLLLRLTVSAFSLLVLGRAQYVAGRRKLQSHTATAAPIRPVAPPSARPIAPSPRPVPPSSRPVVSAASRSQPRSTGINAQDSAMLDALAAQTISGRPIGLNTATGVPSIAETRR